MHYSTLALILLCSLIFVGVVVSMFTSEDLDELCSTNNTFLYRNETTWQCVTLISSNASVSSSNESIWNRTEEGYIHPINRTDTVNITMDGYGILQNSSCIILGNITKGKTWC